MCVCVCLHARAHTCLCVCAYVCMCVFACVCVCICMPLYLQGFQNMVALTPWLVILPLGYLIIILTMDYLAVSLVNSENRGCMYRETV